MVQVLPGTHDMRQQRATALEDAPDGVLLMRRKISVAEGGAHHSGQGQMRTVEIAEPNVVESEVVFLRQPLGAFAIFPNPIAKAILQLLLLLSGGNRLRLIYGAVAVRVLVVGCRRAPIQRLLDQLGRTEAGSTVGRRVVDDVLCAVVEFDRPGRDGLGVSDFHACAAHIQQLGNEVADV